MPTTFAPDDEKQDEKLNPGQADSDRLFGGLSDAEQQSLADMEKNYGQDANPTQEDAAIDRLRNQEAEGSGRWTYDNTEDTRGQRAQKILGFAKKRGGIIGLIALFGVGGGLLAGLLGPAGMLINLTQNLTSANDSSTTAMERRFLKVFSNSIAGSDPICENNTKSMKCKMGRISNKALYQLEKKGIKANFDDTVTNTEKKSGYPSKNPKSYTFSTELVGGSKPVTVDAKDLTGYLAKNPKLAAKVMGTGGAFNLRFKAWTGKYITKKLYKKLGISRDGGLANGKDKAKGKTVQKRIADMNKRLREKIPGVEKASTAAEKIKTKVSGHLGKAKKGGVGYMAMVATCVGVKAPGYIAAGIAAVQLARIAPLIMDVVLSPGAKQQASGVDTENAITPEETEDINRLLTEQVEDEESGKMLSALDSPYLLAALGVNSSKLPVSKKFTPGYAALTNPVVMGARTAEEVSEPACNAIMSPASMYSAMAVDAAVTVAASATVVGGVIKVLLSFAISEAIAHIASDIVEKLGKEIITSLAENDDLTNAKGVEFGDALGISALVLFPSGGAARALPGLKESQVSSYNEVKRENQEYNKTLAIASLSPFDTSSQYTFLGSIVYNIRNAALLSGAYGNVTSMATSIAKLPFQSFFSQSKVGAASNLDEDSCSYAEAFGLDAGDNTPAINVAGLPCTGITKEQAGMSTQEALTLIENEGWLDEEAQVPESATIEDLLSKGYIKKDTPLADFIETCTSFDEGDYLYNAASCTTSSESKSIDGIEQKFNETGVGCQTIDDNEVCFNDDTLSELSDDAEAAASVKDPRSLVAIPVFLLDFQILQSMNGEDEDTGDSSAASTATSTIDMAELYVDSTSVACATGTTDAGTDTGYTQKKPVPIRLCEMPASIAKSMGSNKVLVNSRVSGALYALMTQMTQDLGKPVEVSDSFRTMAEQQCLYSGGCGAAGPAAEPGTSNHQMGLAIDFQLRYADGRAANSGATKQPGESKEYDWLVANAEKYGYKKYSQESWHWSPTGG